MPQHLPQHLLGQIVIQRIVESICAEFDPLSFFPGTTPDHWARHRTWMLQQPQALDPVSGNIVVTIQAFLVLVCATHFPEPSVGRIVQRDKAFWFNFEA